MKKTFTELVKLKNKDLTTEQLDEGWARLTCLLIPEGIGGSANITLQGSQGMIDIGLALIIIKSASRRKISPLAYLMFLSEIMGDMEDGDSEEIEIEL